MKKENVSIGDKVKVLSIPLSLLKDLPQDNQKALIGIIGRVFEVQGFDNERNVELEFWYKINQKSGEKVYCSQTFWLQAEHFSIEK